MPKKKIKYMTTEEMLIDMMNRQLEKGNILEDRINKKYKDKVKKGKDNVN
ncbi:MAG: hypothetical protein JXN65_10245 [Clostridia bacterium]|nr:hypothetical protein [Clostridia bacterium]